MDVAALEGLACATYKRIGFDPSRPVSTFTLARKLLLAEVARPALMVGAPASTFLHDGKRRIAVKAGLPISLARFFAGHELGHVLLDEEGYAGEDLEACCDYLGAALMAPRASAIALQRVFGFDFASIADEVGASETWAALRVGEVLRIPLAVIAPTVRVRGPEDFVWGTIDELRRTASSRRPRPGITKVRLTDDPRRVVLIADELAEVG